MKRILLVICFLALAPWAQAQVTPRQAAENFLVGISQGQVANAYAKLLEGSNIASQGGGAAIRKQTETTLPMFGKVLGFELVREEPFGNALVRLVYVLKSERHPTVWDFYFYRPGNRWFVAEVNFSDKFDHLGPKR